MLLAILYEIGHYLIEKKYKPAKPKKFALPFLLTFSRPLFYSSIILAAITFAYCITNYQLYWNDLLLQAIPTVAFGIILYVILSFRASTDIRSYPFTLIALLLLPLEMHLILEYFEILSIYWGLGLYILAILMVIAAFYKKPKRFKDSYFLAAHIIGVWTLVILFYQLFNGVINHWALSVMWLLGSIFYYLSTYHKKIKIFFTATYSMLLISLTYLLTYLEIVRYSQLPILAIVCLLYLGISIILKDEKYKLHKTGLLTAAQFAIGLLSIYLAFNYTHFYDNANASTLFFLLLSALIYFGIAYLYTSQSRIYISIILLTWAYITYLRFLDLSEYQWGPGLAVYALVLSGLGHLLKQKAKEFLGIPFLLSGLIILGLSNFISFWGTPDLYSDPHLTSALITASLSLVVFTYYAYANLLGALSFFTGLASFFIFVLYTLILLKLKVEVNYFGLIFLPIVIIPYGLAYWLRKRALEISSEAKRLNQHHPALFQMATIGTIIALIYSYFSPEAIPVFVLIFNSLIYVWLAYLFKNTSGLFFSALSFTLGYFLILQETAASWYHYTNWLIVWGILHSLIKHKWKLKVEKSLLEKLLWVINIIFVIGWIALVMFKGLDVGTAIAGLMLLIGILYAIASYKITPALYYPSAIALWGTYFTILQILGINSWEFYLTPLALLVLIWGFEGEYKRKKLLFSYTHTFLVGLLLLFLPSFIQSWDSSSFAHALTLTIYCVITLIGGMFLKRKVFFITAVPFLLMNGIYQAFHRSASWGVKIFTFIISAAVLIWLAIYLEKGLKKDDNLDDKKLQE